MGKIKVTFSVAPKIFSKFGVFASRLITSCLETDKDLPMETIEKARLNISNYSSMIEIISRKFFTKTCINPLILFNNSEFSKNIEYSNVLKVTSINNPNVSGIRGYLNRLEISDDLPDPIINTFTPFVRIDSSGNEIPPDDLIYEYYGF